MVRLYVVPVKRFVLDFVLPEGRFLGEYRSGRAGNQATDNRRQDRCPQPKGELAPRGSAASWGVDGVHSFFSLYILKKHTKDAKKNQGKPRKYGTSRAIKKLQNLEKSVFVFALPQGSGP
jgi:hypothetical protein